jgi:hypothetical protein
MGADHEPRYHLRTTREAPATRPASDYVDSAENTNVEVGLDFSELQDAGAIQHFMAACDYYLTDSDSGDDDEEGYGLTWP